MKFFTGISQVFCLLMFLGTPIEWQLPFSSVERLDKGVHIY